MTLTFRGAVTLGAKGRGILAVPGLAEGTGHSLCPSDSPCQPEAENGSQLVCECLWTQKYLDDTVRRCQVLHRLLEA